MADAAWLGGQGLATDVVIEVNKGRIESITADAAPPRGAPRLEGVVIPGLVNAHSHGFHRALRGRTHRQGGDFWLWRDQMYEVAASLDPEGYEALATAVYTEMALAGITCVGEFHYLHHQTGGVPYRDRNEMGHSLVRAARRAGVRISLLDAGYFTGGFDDRPLQPVQTRFRDPSAEAWLERFEEMRSEYADADDVVVGLAPHSVRAVPEAALLKLVESHREGIPIHVHVSEQPGENRECVDATTLTPTGLLGRLGVLGPDTTLVHCTHPTADDIDLIARSEATVCYCATTERDLADGVGPAHLFHERGIPLSVGTDSHAVIDVLEEARAIELHSRLASGRRGTFSPQQLMEAATVSGAASLGQGEQRLVAGAPADFIVIGTDSPRLAGITGETGLDSIVFAATAADVTDVFVSGRRIVEGGHHEIWEEAKGALDGWSG